MCEHYRLFPIQFHSIPSKNENIKKHVNTMKKGFYKYLKENKVLKICL